MKAMKSTMSLALLGLMLAGCVGCTSAPKSDEYVADPEVEEIIDDGSTASADSVSATTEEAAPVAEATSAPAPDVSATAPVSTSSDSSLSLGTGSSGRGH